MKPRRHFDVSYSRARLIRALPYSRQRPGSQLHTGMERGKSNLADAAPITSAGCMRRGCNCKLLEGLPGNVVLCNCQCTATSSDVNLAHVLLGDNAASAFRLSFL